MNFLKELWKDEEGAVATEYVILVGLVAIALIGTMIAFRTTLMDTFKGFIDHFTAGTDPTETDPGITD